MSAADQALLISTLVVVVVAVILLGLLLWYSYRRRYGEQCQMRARSSTGAG
jgi:uncharacterized membrane protein YqiK